MQQIDELQAEKCEKCKGEGTVFEAMLPGGWGMFITCPACHGTGRKPREVNE